MCIYKLAMVSLKRNLVWKFLISFSFSHRGFPEMKLHLCTPRTSFRSILQGRSQAGVACNFGRRGGGGGGGVEWVWSMISYFSMEIVTIK